MRPIARAALVVTALAALTASSRSVADDEAPAYFLTPFGDQLLAQNERTAVGPDGQIYVAGLSVGTELPTLTELSEADATTYAFVAVFAPDGTLRRVSYAEGRTRDDGSFAAPTVRALSVAQDGAVWLAGLGGVTPVNSPDLGSTEESTVDAWIAKFDAEGTLVYATNLGGAGDEMAAGLAVTAAGEAVLVGTTQSADFPVKDAFQPAHAGDVEDGFVAMFRGDGSGLAWSSFLGTGRRDDATAVTTGASGEIVVLTRAREAFFFGDTGIGAAERGASLLDVGVTRISAGGTLLATNSLPHPSFGGGWALTREPDGRLLVGGAGSLAGSESEFSGWLLRLSSDASSIDGAWREGVSPVRGLTVLAGGDVFVELEDVSAVVLTSGLAFRSAIPVPLQYGQFFQRLTPSPDGSLVVVGWSPLVEFGVVSSEMRAGSMFVGRVPASGTRPPSRVRAVRAGTTTAELTWSGDGDPAERFEVVRSRPDDGSFAGPPFDPVGSERTGPRRTRVTGLRPGSGEQLRLVTVFATGVKSMAPFELFVPTRPVPASSVDAAPAEGGLIEIPIASANGPETVFRVERRIGRREWTAFGSPLGNFPDPDGFVREFDDTRTGGEPRTYRVRAEAFAVRTAWIETAPVGVPATSLIVRVTAASARVPNTSAQRIEVSGRFGADGDAPALAFNPSIHSLQVRAGAPGDHASFVVPAGEAQWQHDGSVLRRHIGRSTRIEIDPAAGRFHVSWSDGFVPRSATRIAVSLAYGGLSGGDEREWRVVPGRGPTPRPIFDRGDRGGERSRSARGR